MSHHTTLPSLLFKHAVDRPEDIALRWKRRGIWKEITWNAYAANVRKVAMGLVKMGLKKGDVVTYICSNRPEWIYFELGCMCMGILPFGVFAEIEDLKMIYHYLDVVKPKIILAEDQEQADKILALRDEVASIERVIVPEYQEVAHYHDEYFKSFNDLLKLGEESLKESPGMVERGVQDLDPNDDALLTTTSGTTGLPKVAVLSNNSIVKMGHGANQVDPMGIDDPYVSMLPTAWLGERCMSIGWALNGGFEVCFPESLATIMRDLREIAPAVIFAPPRTWEGMQATIAIGINDTSKIKRNIYRRLMPIVEEAERDRLVGRPVSKTTNFLRLMAEFAILRQVRDYLGLSKVLYAYTGGAALGPDVIVFFRALGINIKQIFGQSETAGISIVHRNDDIKLETVGKPIPGVEVDVAENNELRVRGETVFKGYFNNTEATAEALRDGYFYTGDYGYIDDDDHVVVIDRLTEMMKLRNGVDFSPQYLETKLKYSPYIREVVAFGRDRDYPVVLIQVDMQVVGNWLERQNIPYTTFADLVSKPQVHSLIMSEFEKINESIPEQMRPKRFTLLTKELDPEKGDITYTGKTRRDNVYQRNKNIVEAMYSDGS
jgi:long-chain acyl-CoA synthetase